jgi:hypothetical protein
MMLDTFNEVLLQGFSMRHPLLTAAYKKAAKKNLHPDYGAWLSQPNLLAVVPQAAGRCRIVHAARVRADLAHAKQKSATAKGATTLPIDWEGARRLMGGSQKSWAEMIKVWSGVI